MFYIWGFGKARKNTGVLVQESCNKCGTSQKMNIVMEYSYGSLFFIPIVKLNKKFFVICPGCGAYKQISKQEFKEIKRANNNALIYKSADVVVNEEKIEPLANENFELKNKIIKEIDSIIKQLKERNYVLTEQKLPNFKVVLKEQLLKTFDNEQVVDETVEEYFKN